MLFVFFKTATAEDFKGSPVAANFVRRGWVYARCDTGRTR